MDHRDSVQREIYGIDGEPTADEAAQISAGKDAIFDGLRAAIDGGVDVARTGVLVDERFGAGVATAAKSAGIDLAMPIERSGQKLFLLEYGNFGDGEWLKHVERFDPDQVKVLVRDNPAGGGNRELQFDRLAAVSHALRDSGRTFLVELLVPAVATQLESVAGDTLRYDRELRPELTVRVIGDMHEAGVEPEIWKIEGLESTDAAVEVVAAARNGGRDAVTCIVLGRDAPKDRLDHWLTVTAGVEGFRGFAIGRSIWEQPLIEHLAGRATRAELVARVAENYTHFVRIYDGVKR
jgi:myo-inositol catabolism protein IolC